MKVQKKRYPNGYLIRVKFYYFYFAGIAGWPEGAAAGAVGNGELGAGKLGAVVDLSTFTSESLVTELPLNFERIPVPRAATIKKPKNPHVNCSNISPVFWTPNIWLDPPPNSEERPPPFGF